MFDAVEVIWAPRRAMESVAGGRKVGLGAGVVALVALLGVVSGIISSLGVENIQGVPPGLARGVWIGGAILGALLAFVGWAVVSLLMQLVTAIFGGSGSLSAMFAVVGVAYAPVVISSVIGIPFSGARVVVESGSSAATTLTVVSLVLGLAFFIWSVVLVIIGAGHARQIGYGKSTGSCAISCVGIVAIVIVLVVLLVLIAAAAGAAGG